MSASLVRRVLSTQNVSVYKKILGCRLFCSKDDNIILEKLAKSNDESSETTFTKPEESSSSENAMNKFSKLVEMVERENKEKKKKIEKENEELKRLEKENEELKRKLEKENEEKIRLERIEQDRKLFEPIDDIPEVQESFASMIRKSKLVSLGEYDGRIVSGKIIEVMDDDLYIDFGGKFHCVCPRPRHNGEKYYRGVTVKLELKCLEMSSAFLGSDKHVTLLEGDATLKGLYFKDKK